MYRPLVFLSMLLLLSGAALAQSSEKKNPLAGIGC